VLSSAKTHNEVYSSLTSRRRYEVWFVRFGLADGSGAWWFRYLLMNSGRGGCLGDSRGSPIQVWATWFPSVGKPQSVIQGFPLEKLHLSGKGERPFYLRVGSSAIEEDSCEGTLEVEGHTVSWKLRYRSNFCVVLSNKGWIGFSRTPHSDATFSGCITLDGRKFEGDPLGFGLQGHNCGYRHRNFWTWTHAYFRRPGCAAASTFEALIYEMPLRFFFRKAVLWHDGKQFVFRRFEEIKRDRDNLQWEFRCSAPDGLRARVLIEGGGHGIHHLPYVRTNCSGTFEVANNSLANAVLMLERRGTVEILETNGGAVLEMVGEP
jgi:hypothetical protein